MNSNVLIQSENTYLVDETIPKKSKQAIFIAATLMMLPLYFSVKSFYVPFFILLAIIVGIPSTYYKPIPSSIRVIMLFSVSGFILGEAFLNGIGRETGASLLLGMLIMKTGELNTKRDTSSLSGFGIFCFFAAFLQNSTVMIFIASVISIISSLWIIHYVNQISDKQTQTNPKKTLKYITKGLLLMLPLGMVGFWFIPRLEGPLWGLPEDAVVKTGVGDSMEPGAFTNLLKDKRTAFRVTFDGEIPPKNQQYWRGPTLWFFDGRKWTRPEFIREIGVDNQEWKVIPTGLDDTANKHSYTVSMEPTERRFRFYLDIPAGGGVYPSGFLEEEEKSAWMAFDYTTESDEQIQTVLSYKGLSYKNLTDERINKTISEEVKKLALQLPKDFNPRTLEMVNEWKNKTTDPEELKNLAIKYIKEGDFAYTLKPPLLGRHSVDEFLFDTKLGFCEHYSSAFVVMMRMAGVPARVVTGYAGGELNRIGGFWRVRQADAHAWTEVWIEGKGWERIDPTNYAQTILDGGPDDTSSSTWGMGAVSIDLADWMKNNWNKWVVMFDYNQQQKMMNKLGFEGWKTHQVSVLIIGIVVTVFVTALFFWYKRNPRPKTSLQKQWYKLITKLEKLGLKTNRASLTGEDLLDMSQGTPWFENLDENKKKELLKIFKEYDESRFLNGDKSNKELESKIKKWGK